MNAKEFLLNIEGFADENIQAYPHPYISELMEAYHKHKMDEEINRLTEKRNFVWEMVFEHNYVGNDEMADRWNIKAQVYDEQIQHLKSKI